MSGPSDAADAKQKLRAGVLQQRAARSPGDLAAAGRALVSPALELCRDVRVVTAYDAFGSEPPTAPLRAALRAAGVQVLLPVVAGDALDWVSDGDPTQRLGPLAIRDADVVMVPALAVDPAGNRLGRGRGYYDRALRLLDHPRLVAAVIYDDELLPELPVEPHDVPVGAALTPGGLRQLAQ